MGYFKNYKEKNIRNMKKVIIVLDGINSDSKTLFSLICKNENHKFYPEDGFWTWQINSSNVRS